MKHNGLCVCSAVLGFFLPALAQTAGVKGTRRDAQAAPIAGPRIVLQNRDTRGIDPINTDRRSEYFSLGFDSANYAFTLNKDGKVLDGHEGIDSRIAEVTPDINLKQIEPQNVQAAAGQQGVSSEEINKKQEGHAKVEKYKGNVTRVNEKLKTAADMMRAQPPNYDQVIAILMETTQIAPDQDVVWYRLGTAYLESAKAETNATEKTKRNTEAYNDIEWAIRLYKERKTRSQPQQDSSESNCGLDTSRLKSQPSTVTGAPVATKTAATPDDHKLAAYYDSLGEAASHLGKNDEAERDFQQAAQLDAADAATYYFNLAIVLRNGAKTVNERREAVQACDKTIAADPKKAAAYYLKGEVLFGMATGNGENIVPQPGTVEALQKYLELEPNGPYAAQAQSFLAALNTRVGSSLVTNKETTKKK